MPVTAHACIPEPSNEKGTSSYIFSPTVTRRDEAEKGQAPVGQLQKHKTRALQGFGRVAWHHLRNVLHA
jgi:hypothetical protein